MEEHSDTSPKMQEAYWKRMAEMTPSERLQITAALCEAGLAQEKAGIRLQHPDADEDEVIFRVAVARYGLELARKAYRRDV